MRREPGEAGGAVRLQSKVGPEWRREKEGWQDIPWASMRLKGLARLLSSSQVPCLRHLGLSGTLVSQSWVGSSLLKCATLPRSKCEFGFQGTAAGALAQLPAAGGLQGIVSGLPCPHHVHQLILFSADRNPSTSLSSLRCSAAGH